MLDLSYLIRRDVDRKKLKKRLRLLGPFRMAGINRQVLRENITTSSDPAILDALQQSTDEMYLALTVFYHESSGLFGNALPF